MEHLVGSSGLKGIEICIVLAIGYFLKKESTEGRTQETMFTATERLGYFLGMNRAIRT